MVQFFDSQYISVACGVIIALRFKDQYVVYNTGVICHGSTSVGQSRVACGVTISGPYA